MQRLMQLSHPWKFRTNRFDWSFLSCAPLNFSENVLAHFWHLVRLCHTFCKKGFSNRQGYHCQFILLELPGILHLQLDPCFLPPILALHFRLGLESPQARGHHLWCLGCERDVVVICGKAVVLQRWILFSIAALRINDMIWYTTVCFAMDNEHALSLYPPWVVDILKHSLMVDLWRCPWPLKFVDYDHPPPQEITWAMNNCACL